MNNREVAIDEARKALAVAESGLDAPAAEVARFARTVIEQGETIERLKETNDELEEDFYRMMTKRNFFRDETRVAHEQIERLQDALREGEVMRRKAWVELGANIDPYGPVDWEAQYESLVYGDMEEE